MCRGGTNVRYIRSTFVTGDGRCMCLFDAPSEGAVRRLNNDANIPYERVIEALDLSPAPTEAGAARARGLLNGPRMRPDRLVLELLGEDALVPGVVRVEED